MHNGMHLLNPQLTNFERLMSSTALRINVVSNVFQNIQLHGVSKELKKQTKTLNSMDNSLNQMNSKLGGIQQQLAAAHDVQRRQLLLQEQQQNLLERQELERSEQKQIKSAVFEVVQSLEYVETLQSSLARHLSLEQLRGYVDESLVMYISKLHELSDKDYANGVQRSLRQACLDADKALTSNEREDVLIFLSTAERVNEIEAELATAELQLEPQVQRAEHFRIQLDRLTQQDVISQKSVSGMPKFVALIAMATSGNLFFLGLIAKFLEWNAAHDLFMGFWVLSWPAAFLPLGYWAWTRRRTKPVDIQWLDTIKKQAMEEHMKAERLGNHCRMLRTELDPLRIFVSKFLTNQGLVTG